MNKKEKWGFALYTMFLLTMTSVSIFYAQWVNIPWLWVASFLLYALWQMDKQRIRLLEVINSQTMDIDYLMSLDPFKRAKKANTEARIASANCYQYLQRIGELKAENEQLRTLNKNLIENVYAGKHKGKRK